MKKLLVASVVAAVISPVASAGVDPDDVPPVPIELVQQALNKSKATPARKAEPKTAIASQVDLSSSKPAVAKGSDTQLAADAPIGRIKLYLRPGVNEIIPISQGHLNRFITPFEDAKAETVDDAVIKSETGILGVATEGKKPVTMFVTEKNGDPRQSLSLTLVPKAIPPREIELILIDDEASSRKAYGSHFKARNWEEGNPYIDTLKAITTDLAKGDVPDGYTMREVRPDDLAFSCGPDLNIKVGQVFEGFNLTAYVAKATNLTQRTIEISEPACYRKGIVAVAPWPDARLDAGASTEIFFVVHQPEPVDTTRVRPSLISEVN